MRPKLQDARTRILVSRDEQAKTLQRIRRAEAHRRERLVRSIKAKDQLAEGIKATREKNSKEVVLARLRLRREKAVIREKSEAWASLHTDGSSWGNSRAPSGCLNTAFSDEDGGSLAPSLTQDRLLLASSSSPPSQRREPHHLRRCIQSRDRRDQGNQPLASPGLAPQSSVSLQPDKASAHLVEDRHRKSPRDDATEDVASLLPQTAPSSLLCGSITDAETGEPLELRWRRWEFPAPSRRANTAGPHGDGDSPGHYAGPSRWRDSATDPEEERAWKSLWLGEGKNGWCRQTPVSADVAQDRGDQPEAAKLCRGGRHGDGSGHSQARQAPEDADEKARDEDRGFEGACGNQHVDVRHGGKPFTVSDNDSYNDNDSSDSEGVGQHYSNTLTDSEQNLDRISSLSSPPGVPSRKRSCTVDAGSCFTDNARNGGTRGPTRATGRQRSSQGRCEPLTPRSIKRVPSPFWVPPSQEPPLSGSSKVVERRTRAAAYTQRSTSSDCVFRRDHSAGIESRDSELSQALVCGGGGGWTGVEKGDATSELLAMLEEAPDERVRQNMLRAQEIRDRYLSQVQQMIMDESVEESRRVAALRAAAGHPLRCRRLQLRHDQEREEKRTLISWIRRDIELIVVQKMAALGLIR